VRERDPFRTPCAKHLFFITVAGVCKDVSETKINVNETDHVDPTNRFDVSLASVSDYTNK